MAVEGLISDLKMLVAFETAADWRETKAMDSAFNAMSWDDEKVKAALPQYLAATGADRAKVDKAFNALVGEQLDTKVDKTFNSLVSTNTSYADTRQGAMHNWLKARLWSYNSQVPFQF